MLSIGRSMSNYTLLRAGRATHLKIVAISVLAAILVVSVGFATRAPVTTGLQRSDSNAAMFKPTPRQNWTSRETATVH